ncbi:hypothetical protein GQ44DRAFT_745751 [Phaeosphaeriaceae sp. PMI808]|nr:hypothetical protein GQ44DRAFT_745751 [Phaeosphaeriaceae sp. PMI808]
MLNRLPKEVYECIVAQLEQLHRHGNQACQSCYLNDLYSLSMVSRAWVKTTTFQMYCKVLLVVGEEHVRLPKLRISGTGRLKLLRRTLRERSTLARCVRELHMSDFQTLYQNATIGQEEITNLVASIVMACPDLERLVGFHISFLHSFDRLSHALSTRPNLKERVWLLSGNPELSDDEDNDRSAYYLAACDPTERFLDLNSNHPTLSTLVLHQDYNQDMPKLNFRAIIGTLRQFPVLRHLSISGLSATSFTNLALNALPPKLQSLRLENLPGINDSGLQRFSTSQLAVSLERLTLINLELSKITTISSILSNHTTNLRHFSFVQQRAPGLVPAQTMTPELSSSNLLYLHWEIRSEAGPMSLLPTSLSVNTSTQLSSPCADHQPLTCLATKLLAASIDAGAFPSLRRVRIPHDPQGLIQALSDIATIRLTHARTLFFPNNDYESSRAKYRDSVIGVLSDSAIESPTSCQDFPRSSLTPARSRIAAQSRILAARKTPRMIFRVYDPHGKIKVDKEMGGYIGCIDSPITYELKPDKSRALMSTNDDMFERNEWITNIEDLEGEPTRHNDELRSSCGHRAVVKSGAKTVVVGDLF